MSLSIRRRRSVATFAAALVPALIGGLVLIAAPSPKADAQRDVIDVVTSQVSGVGGKVFTATNHLVKTPEVGPPGAPGRKAKEFLVVWAGDANIGDINVNSDLKKAPLEVSSVPKLLDTARDALPGPDFFAVIDVDKGSPTYGKVVNTVTLGPLVENEPHHMQYIHHKGDKIYAGALYLDTTYVLDTTQLPLLTLSGVNLPTDTLCGSVPDAYWVLNDGTAYGTYMGGPDVPGPCAYTDGQVRSGNGYAGTPGSLVRLDEKGKTLSEVPAALPGPEGLDCVNLPPLVLPSCANPHGIQVREDLNRLVTSDYAEPRDIILDPVKPPTGDITRRTVRIWDITDRDHAKVVNVTSLPDGPRKEQNPAHEENMAIMETTVTNLPQNKGAFAESMCGGAIYYTPDITAKDPKWREVYDITNAAKQINPEVTEGAGCTGGGWVQTSLDDKYLYHAVIGRGPGSTGPDDQGAPKMIFTLDIQKLVAAGTNPACNIDHISEVAGGGAEADCPKLAGILPVEDETTGGPHWGALDNYKRNADGTYTDTIHTDRFAYSNYFVARTGIDGNHKVCLADVDDKGKITHDDQFIDEHRGSTCVDFTRADWPHGPWGDAKPHSMLFAVAEADVK